MRKLLIAILFTINAQVVFTQLPWRLGGNSNVTNGDFLGTTNIRPIVFKTNGIERGTLFAGGGWRFGSADNNGTVQNKVAISGDGVLSFNGAAAYYYVAPNKYVFRYGEGGLYFKYSNTPAGVFHHYEFRNILSGAPVFHVDASNGNGVFNGTLKVGDYTLPSTDGLSGQVLKTNGSGVLAWSDDLNGGGGANVFLSNLSSPTAINQSLLPGVTNTIDLGSSSLSWKDIYANNALYLSGQKFLSNPGNRCIAIGNQALSSNTGAGEGNVAIGEEALTANTTGFWNTAIGFQSLWSNTSGVYNDAVGFQALRLNTEGYDNSAYGTWALYNNTTGAGNVAIGVSTLGSNTIGGSNVGVGLTALVSNTIGVGNTAVGRSAMGSTTEGWQNTAIGYESLQLNTTGLRNIAIGAGSLTNNVTGFVNIGIGTGADVTAPDLTNAIAIGVNALVDANDKVRIGNTIVSSIGGEVSWTTFSDARYKRNIIENVPGLDFINSLRPITYTVDINALNGHYPKNKKPETSDNLKTKPQDAKEEAALQKLNARIKQSEEEATQIVYTGFAAQEVEAAAKKLNYEFSGVDKPKTENGLYGLRYSDFVVPLVKAMQEISIANDAKDEKITEQQKQIDVLTERIEKMEKILLANYKGNMQNISIGNEAILEQNAPNPFTNGTTIRYQLPEKFSSAQIAVTDNSGKTLKQVSLAGAGKGSLNIDASVLAAGTYNYSLYIDGKLIATRKMILTK